MQMSQLKLFLFGAPKVELNGNVVDLQRRKAMAMLVYLTMTRQSHRRDVLASLFWPESGQKTARNALRRELHLLQQSLGDGWLEATREVVACRSDVEIWVDAEKFRQLVEQVKGSAEIDALVEAAELYRGNFLAGFTLSDCPEFDEWQFFEADGLRREYAGVLEILVRHNEEQQKFEPAIDYARRWLALDPMHEPVHRELMRLFALAGQQAAAVRQYDECVRILDEELGVPPEEETTQLFEAIRTRRFSASKGGVSDAKNRTDAAYENPSALPTLERYVVGELLATGGHGEVYRGRDTETNTPVVIKRLKPDVVQRHPEFVERFQREGEVLRQLDHPNIVKILAVFEHKGQHNIVMEYISGGSLRDLLKQESPLALEQALLISLELADALSRSHHQGIIHRDLKPANVLLTMDGAPRLTDFGIAYLVRDEVRLTQSGALLGSPAYASPEVLNDEEPDARSDIWSFGVLLYEMLAGRPPFVGKTITAIITGIMSKPIPPIVELRADTPPALVDLFRGMLTKERTQRIASMRQVAAELEAIRDGKATPFSRTPLTPSPPPVQQPATPTSAPLLARPFAPVDQQVNHATSADESVREMPSFTPVEPQVFVARQQGMDRLDAQLDSALAGQMQIVFVTGEAGQGKTALLQAFARQAQVKHPQLIVVSGNCNAYTGSGDPYLPFREILELLTGNMEARLRSGSLPRRQADQLGQIAPHTVQALVEHGPDLFNALIKAQPLLKRISTQHLTQPDLVAELQRIASREQLGTSGVQQIALFEQVGKVLQRVALRAPLVLMLEDLHWIDAGSAELLLHLGKRLAGYPILIVGAYRPNDVALGQDGTRHPLAQVIHESQRDFGEILLDLDQAQGDAFVNAWIDTEPNRLDDTFRATLLRQTSGHPLFTVELLRDMKERGDLIQDADGVWIARPDLNWQELPARVEGAIGERISRLEPALYEILQVASVEGDTFTAEALADVLNIDARTAVQQISRELDKKHQLVTPVGLHREGGRRLSRYRFRHILIQRYLYHQLDEMERAYQHEAVGDVLETLYGEQAGAAAISLAYHFVVADNTERARPYLHLAGDQARHASAMQEAVSYYCRALANWPADDVAGQAALRRKLGECLWILGRLQDALPVFEESYTQFEGLKNQVEAGAIQRLIGRIYWELGDRNRSLSYYNKALTILEAIPESVELAWAVSSISQMHMLASEYEEAVSHGLRAIALAEKLGANDVRVHAATNVGAAYMSTGNIEAGEAMLRTSIDEGIELNLPHDACLALLGLGEGLSRLDRYAEALDVLKRLSVYAERIQVPLFGGSAVMELMRLDWLLGNWRAALNRRQQIFEWIERGQGMNYVLVFSHNLFAQMYSDLGQPKQAAQALRQIAEQVLGRGEMQSTGPYLAQVTRTQSSLGALEEANATYRTFLDALDAAASLHTTIGASALLSSIWSLAARKTEDDLDLAKRFQSHLTRIETQTANSPQYQIGLLEGQAVIYLYEGANRKAIEQFQNAVDGWRKLSRPYDELRARNGLLQALRQTIEPTQAQEAADRSSALIEQLASELDDAEMRESFLASSLVQEIRDSERALKNRPPTNLPAQPTPFIGRAKELAEIRQLLRDDANCRLLTLLGPGGIGKTRLAIEAATGLLDLFPDGVYFVGLAAVGTAETIGTAIADAFGFTFSGNMEPDAQLTNYLRAKRLLLVVDNLEHLLAGAELFSAFALAATQTKILVTSREALRLQEEWLYPVGGMTIPKEAAPFTTVTQNGAIQLFVQQAQRADAAFVLNDENLPSVIHICRAVDGMPLGIELAAAWLRTMTCDEIAKELTQSIDILTTSIRNVPQRHRSLRAIVEQTWQRLDEREQMALQRLAIFRGSFSREAAQQVTQASLLDISSLVDKALCRHNDGHYEMHELLRQFAFEQLNEEELQTVQLQHSQYFAAFLREQQQYVTSAQAVEMLQRVADAFDNIVAACHYLSDQLQSGDNVVQFAQLLNDYLPILTVYCNRRGLYREGQRILRYILDALDRLPADQVAQDAAVSRLHFQTQIEQAHALMPLGRYQEARDTLLSFIPRLRSPTNEEQLPHALSRLGAAYRQLGELAEAEQSLSQALALYERIDGQIDLQRKIALALLELGSVKFDRALYKDAHIYFQRALAIYEDAGDVGGVARCLHAMGIAYEADGDIEQAAPYYERGYRLALRAGNSVQVAVLLAKLGNCAYQAGNTDEALEKYLAAIDVFRQSGHMPWLTDRLIKVAAIYIERAELDIAAIHLVDALTFVQQNNLSLFEADALAVAARLLAHMDQHALAVSMATFASGSKHLQDGYLQFCETVLHTLHETMDAAAYDRAQTFGRDSSSMPMIDEAIHALD